MIRILIAEDQLLIQQDICKKIEKTGKEISIIGTALNGADAYEQICTLHPDILITDIRMPLMGGLQLIRRLKEEKIPIKTVILSGYKDFEYAKEAIQLGVDEYLLKPVSVSDLSYALDGLEEKILSEKNVHVLQILGQALHSGTPIPKSLSDSLNFTNCQLMLVNLDSCATFSFQDWLPCKNELEELLKGPVVHKYLKPGETVHIFNGQTYNQKLLVFLLLKTTTEKLDMMAAELQKQLNQLTYASTICISTPFPSLNGLGSEYKFLSSQLANQLVFAASSLLHRKDFLDDTSAVTPLLGDTQLDSFRFHTNARNQKEFLLELHRFLEVCQTQRATQTQLSAALKNLLHTCFDANEKNLTGRDLEIDEYLSNSKTYQELELSLELMFGQLLMRTPKTSSDNASSPEALVEEVKQYIRSNYGKNMNINDIAVHFSITPTYLSRLFKKYSDVRPIEYLTSYRIQQACDYFTHSQLSVCQVAELCGYSNQFYFSKAFKQITSMSPSEYRIKHQGET